jgi:hypothetical protein
MSKPDNKHEADHSLREHALDVFTKSDGLISVAVVLLGFLIATIIILAVGRNAGGMYSAILQVVSGWDLRRGVHNVRYIGEWFTYSMPLILCGLSMGFAPGPASLTSARRASMRRALLRPSSQLFTFPAFLGFTGW